MKLLSTELFNFPAQIFRIFLKGMNINIIGFTLGIFLGLALYSHVSHGHQAKPSCLTALTSFQAHPGTLAYYQQEQAQQRNSEARHPQFLNPQDEVELTNLWQGELGPELLNRMLPEGITFIGHQLQEPKGEGIVKSHDRSEFVMLRVEIEWNGQKISTNISVPVTYLVHNLSRNDKWLIGPEAKALIDWGHGGGTKTTGNHTSIGPMGHLFSYNIAVLAMDQPWHGEGARHWFANAKDFFSFRKAFLQKFIHPEVPIFGAGHSMGGQFADMMMRLSDDPELNLREVYKGFISLSGVADQAPGGSYLDKNYSERSKQQEDMSAAYRERIAPGDQALGEMLIRSNKVSPLSMFFAHLMALQNDWTIPHHQGGNFLPTLYIWGEADFLFVGNEGMFRDYLTPLNNTQLMTFTPRINFKGEVEPIGHLIFDHNRPYDHPDATAYLLKFATQNLGASHLLELPEEQQMEALRQLYIEGPLKEHYTEFSANNPSNLKTTALLAASLYWLPEFQEFFNQELQPTLKPNETLEAAQKRILKKISDSQKEQETYTLVREFVEQILGEKLEPRNKTNDHGALAQLLKAYANILPFREFVKDAEVKIVRTSPDFIQRMEDAKKLPRTDAERLLVFQIASHKYVPEDPILAERAQSLIAQRQDLANQIKALNTQKEAIRKTLRQTMDQKPRLEKALLAQIESLSTPLLSAQRTQEESIFNRLFELDEALRFASEDYVTNLLDAYEGVLPPNAIDNLPPELTHLFTQYTEASHAYNRQVAQTADLIQSEALSGNLGPEIQSLAENIWGTHLQHNLNREDLLAMSLEEIDALSISDKITILNAQMLHLEGQVIMKRALELNLMAQYVDEIIPEYMSYDTYYMRDLLNPPPESDAMEWYAEHRGVIEKLWGQWGSLWEDKPPGEAVSLY